MKKWLEIALKEIGVKEIRGGENARIIEYHASTTLKAREDEIPWCSSFVNWVMTQAGYKGTNSAAAKSWLSWGKEIPKPEKGCICVIKKKSAGSDAATGSASGYHVGFFVSEDANYVYLIGGNQSDQVKISGFNLRAYDICGYRMPEEVIKGE